MKTQIIEQEQQAKPDDSYPRLWKNRKYGDIWIQTDVRSSVCLHHSDRTACRFGLTAGDFFKPEIFERITTPITIRFEP